MTLPLRLFILAGAALALQAPPQALTPGERSDIAAALARDETAVILPANPTDADLIAQAQAYARTALGQRVRPLAIDKLWAIEPPRRDVAAEFAAARAEGRLGPWLQAAAPATIEYDRLQAAYRQYATLAAQGGWSPLPAGKAVKPGDTAEVVVRLRARLVQEGYAIPTGLADTLPTVQVLGAAAPALTAPSARDPAVFDPGLAAALALFQTRHGLEPDGKLGAATRQALIVPALALRDQIEANPERLRWLPRPLPRDRVEVDTGLAEATLFRDNQPALTMRTVVGKPKTKTPMFVSQLEAVVFNPPWNVPAEIARAEILPKAARQPGYWESEGFTHTANGVQQKPGPKNALGQLKFDLPSPFGVYLHDTPSRSAFARSNRALSHGCMRLEKPKDLAQLALAWSPDAVDAAIKTGETKRQALPAPIPLFVVHRTVFVDAAGVVNFRLDPYGWDDVLTRALASARPVVVAELPHVTECSIQRRG